MKTYCKITDVLKKTYMYGVKYYLRNSNLQIHRIRYKTTIFVVTSFVGTSI